LIFVDFSKRIKLKKAKFDRKPYYALFLMNKLFNLLTEEERGLIKNFFSSK